MILKLVGGLVGLALPVMMLDLAPPYTGPYHLQDKDHDRPMVSGRLLARKPMLSVLFIGNSFTFTNDIPAQVVNLAAADPGSPLQLSVSSSTIPAASLLQAWKQGDALRLLHSRHFDYVILQEQSSFPFRDQEFSDADDAVGRWTQAARTAGANPVLYETWADKEGSESYGPNWTLDGMTPSSAQAAISQATHKLATAHGLPVIDVGDPFTIVAQAEDAPNLFNADGHHPSEAGAFVSASVIYQALTGQIVGRSTYRPPEVSVGDAVKITQILGNRWHPT